MKALVLEQHGTLDNVVYAECPTPQIGPDDVLVEIKAAALNRLDLWVLHGWRGLRLDFPHIMGCDGSGVIAEVGASVERFEIDDTGALKPLIDTVYPLKEGLAAQRRLEAREVSGKLGLVP